MRHLYYLLLFFIAGSIVFSVILFKKREPVGIPAIIINDKIITQGELKNLLEQKPDNMDRLEFKNNLITREILIQEAIKEKIHKEESFRKAIEDHYENLLISILKDRKYSSIKVNVTNRDAYNTKLGEKISQSELESIKQNISDKKKQEEFDNWIESLKNKSEIKIIEQ